VVLSGDVAGWIAPCGCASNQSGGLLRRATYLKLLRGRGEVISADVGGAAQGSSPYDRLRFEAILKGDAEMGLAGHNVGAAEARLGPEYLRGLAAKGDVHLLSANVRDRAGRLVAQPLRIVAAAGRRVALVGVLAECYGTPEFDVAPPRQAVLDALRAAKDQYDAAIVLAYLPEDELRQLAEGLPEADAIVGGPTGQPVLPQRVGATLLCSATNEGKFLVRLDAPGPEPTDRWTGGIIELSEQFVDEPGQVENLHWFHQALLQDFSPQQTSFVEPLPPGLPKGFAVAGTASCRKCHEEDYQAWRKSKHREAWRSLKGTVSHVDPQCQRCHTTGYGLPGGFASFRDDGPPKDRVNVGCENCHGPSLGHVAVPAVHTPNFGRAKDSCIGCHDHENSPKFDYDKYWKDIDHGETPGKDPEEAGKAK
jgi:hypothetical protein